MYLPLIIIWKCSGSSEKAPIYAINYYSCIRVPIKTAASHMCNVFTWFEKKEQFTDNNGIDWGCFLSHRVICEYIDADCFNYYYFTLLSPPRFIHFLAAYIQLQIFAVHHQWKIKLNAQQKKRRYARHERTKNDNWTERNSIIFNPQALKIVSVKIN